MDDVLKNELLMGREHYGRREYEQAEKHLLEVIKQTQSYADVYNMLGVIQHDRAEFQAARTYFEKAIEINPNYAEACLNLAVTYNDLGLYSEARKTYAEMITRTNDDARLPDPYARKKIANMHAELAVAYTDYGMHHEAVHEYRKALRLAPSFADIRTRLGNILRELGDLDGAKMEYREALRSNPKYPSALVALGITLLAQARRDEAREVFEHALAIDAANKPAQMYLRMIKGNVITTSPPPRPNVSDVELSLADSLPDIKVPKNDD
jgi:tetratricopeptide (TPR) repeat protein